MTNLFGSRSTWNSFCSECWVNSPRPTHFEAVFGILRYLKRTPRQRLLFKKGEHLMMEAYTNADWVGDVNVEDPP